MEALLHRLVDIDSNSFDKAGTDAVGEAIIEVLQADGIAVTRIPKSGFGDVLRAEVPGRQANSYALLLGHRDTVFKTGTVATRGYSRKGDLAFGPGVADMKAGLVANIFALRAIKAAGGLAFPVVALFTADEEIGSPTGRAEIETAARGARAVFNTEPGRVSGNVVTGRKGGGSFHITVKGRAAHSGVNHQDGASAIEALARKIVRLHALTDYATGITTNVGVIKGGNTHNTVAPWAEAELDLRFVTLEQHAQLVREIEAIVHADDVPGTQRRDQAGRDVPAARAPAFGDAVRALQGGGGACRFCRRRRVHRRLRRLRLHRRARRADLVRPRPGRRQGAHRRGVLPARYDCCRGRRPWPPRSVRSRERSANGDRTYRSSASGRRRLNCRRAAHAFVRTPRGSA